MARIKLTPFTVTIPEKEKDKTLPEKLKAELPGILAWAVQGCLDWQRHGMEEPDEVRAATAEYQGEQDVIEKFLDECCIRTSAAKVKVSALFEAYGKWSGDKFTTQPEFNKRLRAKGFDTGERGKYGYQWCGIGLFDSGLVNQYEPRLRLFSMRVRGSFRNWFILVHQRQIEMATRTGSQRG